MNKRNCFYKEVLKECHPTENDKWLSDLVHSCIECDHEDRECYVRFGDCSECVYPAVIAEAYSNGMRPAHEVLTTVMDIAEEVFGKEQTELFHQRLREYYKSIYDEYPDNGE